VVDASGVRVAVVVARFNADVTERLLEGALACLSEHGGSEGDRDVFYVPGAWELPQAVSWIVERGRHDAVVTLGCVIRGDTPHFDYVCARANDGLGRVASAARVPVVFGVLTTDTRDQALERASGGPTNKGYEVTLAALDMAVLARTLEGR
jgi:6,7-dimethyl-8-ribityllumazine synthase